MGECSIHANKVNDHCIINETYYDISHAQSMISSSKDSTSSIGSASSTDQSDDASSSFSSSSSPSLPSLSSPPNGPPDELSELTNHLPIKKGLSKYYQGKSQSFTSLSNVRCIEDLAKRNPHFKRTRKFPYSPKAIISKTTVRRSLQNKGGSFRPPHSV